MAIPSLPPLNIASSSSATAGDAYVGGFNFSPNNGISKKEIAIAAVGIVVVWLLVKTFGGK